MNPSTIENHPIYKEFMTELKICRTGGVFLSLYKNKSAIKNICGRIERSLPEYLILPMEVHSKKTEISAFLEKESPYSGKKSNIFHIIETDSPTEQFISDFIDYLLYTRKRFKSRPYAMVFWVTPEFEKQLFYSAPDLYSLISGTYDFTVLESDSSVKTRKDEPKPNIRQQVTEIPSAVDQYLAKTIRQYRHWSETVESGQPFLIDAMSRWDIYNSHIPLNYVDASGNWNPLEDALDRFIGSPELCYMTVAGEPGIENTACLIQYYIRLASHFLGNRSQALIPIFISLKAYQGKINLNDIVLNEFYERFGIGPSSGVFQDLAREGRFVFLIDGFGDITPAADLKPAAENLKTIIKMSFKTIKSKHKPSSSPNIPNKVIMSCVSHHVFMSAYGSSAVPNDHHTRLFGKFARFGDHRIVKTGPPQINAQRMEHCILWAGRDKTVVDSLIKMIRNEIVLAEFASESLIFDLIRKTIPLLESGKDLTVADLYRTYIDLWINRDDWRCFLKPEGKRVFLWDLSLKMAKKKRDYRINSKRIDPPKKNHLKDPHKQGDIDFHKEEALACPFLELDETGYYRFVHGSFVEYCLADYYFHCIKNNLAREITYSEFTPNMKLVLKMIICSNKNNLEKIDLCGINLEQIELDRANLKFAKLQRTQLNQSRLSGADFEGADLTRTSLRRADLENADLSKAKLIQTDFTEANLMYADLTEADLQRSRMNETNLSGAKLEKAKLNDVDLTNARLSGANLKNADMRWSTLQRVDFKGADMSKASLLRANCGEADFTGACLQQANLSDADMTRAVLEKADMKNANLNKTNLYEANLQGVDLTRANLQKANLQRADFRGANLGKANLIKSDLRWANLGKADLSGADFWQANLNEADLTDAIYNSSDLEKAYSDGVKLK